MSIRQKIIMGFSVIVMIGICQGLFLLYNFHQVALQVNTVFSGPFAAVDHARAAEVKFRTSKDHLNKVTSMTSPIDSKASLVEFKSKYGSFHEEIAKLGASTHSEKAIQILRKVEQNGAIWQKHALSLLGEKPALSIPSPHIMSQLANKISADLDFLAGATIQEAKIIQEEIGSTVNTSEILAWALILLSLVLGLGLALIIALSIIRPLNSLKKSMLSIAQGDVNEDVSELDRKDEIGEMAKALEIFKDNSIKRRELETLSEEEKFEQSARQNRIDSLIAKFRSEVQESLLSVTSNAEKMQNAAKTLDSVASSASANSVAVNALSSEATNNVKIIATTTDELTNSISEIDQQVAKTKDLVASATDEGNETNTKVIVLNEAADEIGNVISLIQDIAEQTNLLALNATIEAARAGEAGKGFAVVASEVKELASQTAKATEEISRQIARIQQETSGAVGSIQSIVSKITDVNEFTATIAAAIEEQGMSTTEIARNIQEASCRTEEVSENISGVEETSHKTSQTSKQVLSSSMAVTSETNKMTEIVDEFLKEVAAA